MVCEVKKTDSNITGLSFAEEVCLKQLPVLAVDGFDPIWYQLEPNSYSDFGGEFTKVARSPINPSRQNQKGVITDLDASGGYQTDFTSTNLQRLLQGFFFASAREKPTTAPMNVAPNLITGVTAADDKYATTATAIAFNKAGLLVKASGFAVAANNGLHVVVSADANDITVGDGLVNEAAPPAVAKVEVVGYQFAAADAAIVVAGSIVSLTSTAAVLAALNLIVGEWLFIGGDTLATNQFANNLGFARIKSIAAGVIVFDDVAFTGAPVSEVSTGKTIRIFFGMVIRNEKLPALIVKRSYQFERTLGVNADGDPQAEYLEGSVANELTINIPTAEKLTADLSFVACDNSQRTGEVGDVIKSLLAGATIIAALGEDALNTTSNVYRLKMYVHDALSSNPSALFGYVTEGNISINNGVTPNKAIGVLGAFDVSSGNFVVSGSLTAYFTTIEAVRAVRNNADVGFNAILTSENKGQILDIPLLGLGGGRLDVQKDQSIMVPLEPQAAECAAGYTMMYNSFAYLPDVAMPE